MTIKIKKGQYPSGPAITLNPKITLHSNEIKTMKRQAYGFRDQAFFKLRILAIHETKYALVG